MTQPSAASPSPCVLGHDDGELQPVVAAQGCVVRGSIGRQVSRDRQATKPCAAVDSGHMVAQSGALLRLPL